jgi:hypothetical protein
VERERLANDMKKDDPQLSRAMANLSWKHMYRMEGVAAYQTQNIYRMKVNRLRMWGGTELGYQCLAESCRGYRGGTTAHLVWGCPVARAFWEVLRSRWGKKEPATAAEKADEMRFSGTD